MANEHAWTCPTCQQRTLIGPAGGAGVGECRHCGARHLVTAVPPPIQTPGPQKPPPEPAPGLPRRKPPAPQPDPRRQMPQ